MKQTLAIAVLLATFGIGGLHGCASTNAGAQTQAQAQVQPNAQKSDKKYRVVFHVTENNPQKWNIVLNNAGNIQDDLGKDNVIIEIVTHGPGIDMLKAESKVAPRLAQALDRNVGLFACENTMRNAKVTKADMYGGISYALSGVSHILQRQSEGWYYLRP
ncbi:MAG: DsrE family protein [Betaproteobacteria bacterium]|nr:DsrE family protein [Betaproteobacteria bacterium]